MAKRLTRAERARREREIAARAKTAGGAPAASSDPSSGVPARVPVARPRATDWRAARGVIGSELAERAAWSMLAALAALVGAGLALALGGAIVPSLCPSDDGTCTFGWMVVIGMVGYVVALLPACAIGGLGIWFWVAYLVGFSPLMVLASIGDWWWWTALVLLPPVAAIASSPFGRLRITPWQRWTLLGLALIGIAAVVWWYGFAS